MSDRPEFIQLSADDDVLSIRDRLSFIRGKQVLLIWPEHGTVLTRKLDLVLIQREAMRRAIRLALVTDDPDVIENATDLNISTFATIGESERKRWKRGRAKVFTDRHKKPEEEPEPEELMPVASRVRISETRAAQIRRAVSRMIAIVLLVAVTGAVTYIVVPSATVTLIPAQERLQVRVEMTADPNVTDIDLQNSVIPATRLRIEVEETGTLPTTGRQDLADIPASGTAVFVNQTDGEVVLPAGTIVTTSDEPPVRFRTGGETVVPPGYGLQVEVGIEALQESAGAIGNLESGQINRVEGDLAANVTVRNVEPTTGGETRSMPAVSDTDPNLLLSSVRQQLQTRAYNELTPRINDSQILIVETIRIVEERSDWITFSAQPGEVADQLTVTMRAIVEALAIERQFGQQVAFAQISRQVPDGRVINLDTMTYDCCQVTGLDDEGRVLLSIGGSGVISGQIDAGVVQQQIIGMSRADAIQQLAAQFDLQDGTTPDITLSPAWLPHLPLLPMRITVNVLEVSV